MHDVHNRFIHAMFVSSDNSKCHSGILIFCSHHLLYIEHPFHYFFFCFISKSTDYSLDLYTPIRTFSYLYDKELGFCYNFVDGNPGSCRIKNEYNSKVNNNLYIFLFHLFHSPCKFRYNIHTHNQYQIHFFRIMI